MKYNIFLFLLLFLLLLSCTTAVKDDSDPIPVVQKPSILGAWAFGGDIFLQDFPPATFTTHSAFLFEKNGAYVGNLSSASDTGPYTFYWDAKETYSHMHINLDDPDSTSDPSWKYSYDGERIILKSPSLTTPEYFSFNLYTDTSDKPIITRMYSIDGVNFTTNVQYGCKKVSNFTKQSK